MQDSVFNLLKEGDKKIVQIFRNYCKEQGFKLKEQVSIAITLYLKYRAKVDKEEIEIAKQIINEKVE